MLSLIIYLQDNTSSCCIIITHGNNRLKYLIIAKKDNTSVIVIYSLRSTSECIVGIIVFISFFHISTVGSAFSYNWYTLITNEELITKAKLSQKYTQSFSFLNYYYYYYVVCERILSLHFDDLNVFSDAPLVFICEFYNTYFNIHIRYGNSIYFVFVFFLYKRLEKHDKPYNMDF